MKQHTESKGKGNQGWDIHNQTPQKDFGDIVNNVDIFSNNFKTANIVGQINPCGKQCPSAKMGGKFSVKRRKANKCC